MITSVKQWEDMFINPAMKKLAQHSKLVSEGVDSRSALEMTFGKKEADAVYDIVADATRQPKTINEKNN